jgi:hypothetical protein
VNADFVPQFAALRLKAQRVTASHQGVASTFTKRTVEGWGYLPSSVRFDPLHFRDDRSLYSVLVPSPDDCRQARRLRLYGEKPSLVPFGETESNGVNAQLSAIADEFGLYSNGQKTLGRRGLAFGIANGASYEDLGIWATRGVVGGIIENKGGEGSISAAVVQAAVTGSNVAMQLLALGLPSDQCVVPVIGNTGIMMAFGAVVVLRGSFASFVPLSKRLDLGDPIERTLASAYLEKAVAQCHLMGNTLRELQPNLGMAPYVVKNNVDEMSLDVCGYHVKRLSEEVFARGLGLFASSAATDHYDVGPGFEHMIEVLNLIFASETAREFAEYPLSIRTPDEQSDQCYELIYRDLVAEGFQIGAPDRITDGDMFAKFVTAFKSAVASVHEAGVIHVDLYLSNVMWRVVGDAVEIKLIDWDAAHCLDEGDFVPKVKSELDEYLGAGHVHFGVRHDLLYVSVLDLTLTKYHENQWQALASRDKKKIDMAFRALLQSVIESIESASSSSPPKATT